MEDDDSDRLVKKGLKKLATCISYTDYRFMHKPHPLTKEVTFFHWRVRPGYEAIMIVMNWLYLALPEPPLFSSGTYGRSLHPKYVLPTSST